MHRKEDQRLLTGHGQYVDDVALPGMLHAAFLRSDVAKATITRLDVDRGTRRCRASSPCFTWQDFDGQFGEAWHAMLGEELQVPPPLAITDVRHVGDPIALVVAESRYLAEDACELIEVEFESSDPCVDFATAAADTEHLVHGAWGFPSNAMVRRAVHAAVARPRRGVRRPRRTSSSATIQQNRYMCVPMEGRGIVADWAPGRDEIDIVCSCQGVHETRNFFARYLRHPRGQHPGHGPRRRRRLRPEDVRVPRGVRRRARLPAARPAGEVDRGPPREPDRRRPLPQRARARSAWPSTTTT